jgi:UDP-N-acetylmuramate dehydrogenase
MAFESLARELTDRLGAPAVAVGAPLAPLTTFKVGGPADLLVRVGTVDALADVLTAARAAGAPVTVIGGGSNLLVADTGVRGVVLRLALTSLEARSADCVRAGAGVTMNGLVRWTVGRGAAGLEAWAGTPGTVGGAICGNAHYGGRNISELVATVGLVDATGLVTKVDRAQMGFAYDTSRVQQTREIVAWADFRVAPGDSARLRATARASLAHRKRTQPLASQSAGCVFQNPDRTRDRVPEAVPASAGALVDRVGLKGRRLGGAMISTLHANFIVNTGGATAADIAGLMALARRAVRERFDVDLRDEIVRLGDIPS